MPYTNDPVAVPQDAVMSQVGDTDIASQLLTDEQYAKFLADTGGNIGLSAHRAALAIEGKYAKLVDETIGPLRYAYSQQAKAYHDLAINLLASASADPIAMRYVAPLAGGIVDPTTGNDIPNFFSRTTP